MYSVFFYSFLLKKRNRLGCNCYFLFFLFFKYYFGNIVIYNWISYKLNWKHFFISFVINKIKNYLNAFREIYLVRFFKDEKNYFNDDWPCIYKYIDDNYFCNDIFLVLFLWIMQKNAIFYEFFLFFFVKYCDI